MAKERSTVQHGLPSSRGPESEALRRAFVRAGVADAELPEPAAGDEVGRYTVLGNLGQGGMGVVYKAYDPQLDRNVALKLLRRVIEEDDAGSELRLLREAQMLAQLQHPNVVAVYDSGLTRYGVFIAMELLYGCTLRDWLDQRVRSVREVLEVFRAAGNGLAAAHDAGFVHRDIKPSNVIVGDDGTVRVLDFGVAALMDPRLGSVRNSTGSSRRHVSRPPGAIEPLTGSDPHLTDDGCVVGTPAYMAPEQVAGDRADHRSDQFSFCLCLHVALYGRSPVIGEGFEERRWNMSRGRVIDEHGLCTGSTAGRVPARVRRMLRRGLSVQPSARFASMSELLSELRDPPRRWPLVVAGSMLGLGFGAGLFFDVEANPCADPTIELERAWGAEDRAAVRAAFGRSGHPKANELHGRVEQQLGRYAAAWSTMYTESCHATYVARQQSVQLHDQRLRCLERRRNRMRAAVDALGRIEGPEQVLDRTLMPFQLPRIADCADLEAVSTSLPLPDDPELRRTVMTLRRTIDEAEILKDSGDLPRGLELAQAVVESARATQFTPVIAEALGSLGSLQAMGSSAREAQATLEDSIVEAAKAGDDLTAARSWTWLIYALTLQRRFDEGKALELAARAAVERADDDTTRGWLLNNLGALYGGSGDFELSRDLVMEAIEVKKRTLGEEHVDVGISWFNLGSALLEHEHYPEAREALERAQSIFEATVGPAHPLSYIAVLGMCQIANARGEFEVAIGLCGRVLKHFEVSPSSHVLMGRTYRFMAEALRGMGRLDEARAHANRGLELVGADDPELAREMEAWLAETSDPPAGTE